MASKKSKLVIAIDIDDVLSDNAHKFIQYTNEKWGFNFTLNDYTEHWDDLWKVDNAEVCKRSIEYHSSGILSKYCHKTDAVTALNKLKKDFDIMIVSSRNAISKQETINWIKEKYPGLFDDDSINFTNFFKADANDAKTVHLDKGDICKKLGASYLIDDQPKHCLGAAKNGIKALMYGNYPWNQMKELPKNVTRVNDWQEVLEYFYGKNKG